MNELLTAFWVNQDDANRIRSSVNAPHRHEEFEELIIGFSGSVNHFIDFEMHVMEAPFALFVSKNKIHRVEPLLEQNDCKLFVIRFKSEVLAESMFRLYSTYHGYANLHWKNFKEFEQLKVLVNLLVKELSFEQIDWAICRGLLNTIFACIERERKSQFPDHKPELSGYNQSFGQFLRLLEEGYKRPIGVEQYASQLFMSSRNLNLICRQLLQLSASEVIENRKLLEAGNLLLNTEMTVFQIADELGYSESAYFSKVFKRKTGYRPMEYRKEMRKVLS